MELQFARFEVDAEGVGLLTLDYPDSKVNKLSDAVWAELSRLVDHWRNDTALRAVVIASAKRGIFLAGADIEELQHIDDTRNAAELCARAQEIFDRLETCGKPVVCAVAGAALGGGMELVLAAHALVVATDGKVKLGLPETKLGLIPGAGGTQRLARLVGVDKAAELVVSGDWFGPEEAVRLKLAAAAVPSADLVPEARSLALRLANGEFERRWAPLAVTGPEVVLLRRILALERADPRFEAWVAGLTAVTLGATQPMADGLRVERDCFAALATGAAAKDLIRRFLAGERL